MECFSIMLVEDEILIGREIQSYLREMGYEVCHLATSGEEALLMAEQCRPDLALMDISLQGDMDGIETACRLRAQWGTAAVFLTAYADTATLEQAKRAQPFGFLVKPVGPLELRAALEMAMARLGLERERERLITELQQALAQVKLLSGLLPICANCKKIRDDKGYWKQVETFISEHSEAIFSHGICPECVRKHYPDLADDVLPED